jgi:prepilin-type N-terminal cleavage/methylation domain-containing protein
MKRHISCRKRGFTLLETVIAIGVLAVLLTGFMIVFAPAAAGIRKAINVQEADRLTSALEQELVTLRSGEQSAKIVTGFDKAFQMIEDAMKKSSPEVIFVYQYRGDLKSSPRSDGTYEPYDKKASDGVPGEDYIVVPMARRRVGLGSGTDPYFQEDLKALDGRVFAVKTNQLVFTTGGQLSPSTSDKIEDPTPTTGGTSTGGGSSVSGNYPEAVIAFSADFFGVQSSSYDYLKSGGKFDPSKLKNPMFSRNLAVRR